MPITIRKLTPDDTAIYRECRLDALRDTPTAFASSYEEEAMRPLEAFRDRLSGMSSATFGAFDGKRLIGLTGIFRERREKLRHKMFIVSVFVRPEYRGKKVGAALIEAAISYARNTDGVESVQLSVESSNTAAKALYASFGFQTWGTEPDFSIVNGKRYDEDYMSLKL
jgi:RimJ/RimL family protein N-acetyltransferase